VLVAQDTAIKVQMCEFIGMWMNQTLGEVDERMSQMVLL
jgi:hypothetical protein